METTTTERYDKQTRLNIANTILDQFAGGHGPRAFISATGAKNLVALDGGVQFSIDSAGGFNTSGINRVKVILTPLDEYDITFSKVTFNRKNGTFTEKVIKEHKGVYCDQLSDLFYEATNLLPYLYYLAVRGR